MHFHPGIQTGDFRPSLLQRESKIMRMSVWAFFDLAHQLLGGESMIGVCGGQGCDARYLARVKIDVLGRDGLYMFGFDQGGGRL